MSATQASAARPASIKVHKSSGNTMEILWKDGHLSTYTFTYLRDACPCALCNDEREKSHRQPDQPAASVSPAMGGMLPMFKPAIRPDVVEQAGNYAIRFDWNDGHKHGIFSWQYLRDWCPCAECHASRHSSDGLLHDIDHHPPRQQ